MCAWQLKMRSHVLRIGCGAVWRVSEARHIQLRFQPVDVGPLLLHIGVDVVGHPTHKLQATGGDGLGSQCHMVQTTQARSG